MGKILINGRFLSQVMTGVQRYASELTSIILEIQPSARLVVPSDAAVPEAFAERSHVLPGKGGVLWEQFKLASYAKAENAVLLNLCNSAPIRYDKNVVFIHDLGVHVNAKWYSKSFAAWYKFMQPRVIRSAKCVATVSETIKNEIQAKSWRAQSDVVVLYPSISPVLVERDQTKKDRHMVLVVGTESQRKNRKRVLEAFSKVKNKKAKLLVVGGKDPRLTGELNEWEGGDERVIFQGRISDLELRALYAQAQFVISASNYEGFNLPILEGVLNGAIPVLSDIPVHRELYPDSKLFFDPNDDQQLERLLIELLDVESDLCTNYKSLDPKGFSPEEARIRVERVLMS